MNDMDRLRSRFRWIVWTGVGIVAVSCIAWVILGSVRPDMNGLLLGEAGGAWVVYSMLRQGHLRDGMQGAPLFLSGMLGMGTRFLVLIAVMVVAVKTPDVSPIFTLVGYLLAFVLVAVGVSGFLKKQGASSGESR
jgi:hypothetical protein